MCCEFKFKKIYELIKLKPQFESTQNILKAKKRQSFKKKSSSYRANHKLDTETIHLKNNQLKILSNKNVKLTK